MSNFPSKKAAAAEPANAVLTTRGSYLLIAGVMLLVTLSALAGLFFYKQSVARKAAQQEAAHARALYRDNLTQVMASFDALQQAIATGVSFTSYNERLLEVVSATEILVQTNLQDELPPSREAVKNALAEYMLAHDCWSKKLDNRLAFIDSEGIDHDSSRLAANDPLYVRLIAELPVLATGNSAAAGKPIDLNAAIKLAWQQAAAKLAPARAALAAAKTGRQTSGE
jgi:hypothetical protein